jgi:hypothetical protein
MESTIMLMAMIKKKVKLLPRIQTLIMLYNLKQETPIN